MPETPMPTTTWADLREVELFLFREAELADQNDYPAWFSLWTEDLLYCVPCNSDDIAPARKIAIIYDDRPKLEERIYRLGTKFAHSQRPKSRLSRSVNNIVLGSEYDPAHGGAVTSRFVLAEVRNDEQRFWAGHVRHVLARVDGQLRMKEKVVYLLANDLPLVNMTFIL